MSIQTEIALVSCVLTLTVGCANTGIKHVSAEEFIRHAKSMEQMSSSSATSYVGASWRRAYVERDGFHRLFQGHEAIVYWTWLSDLPPDLVVQLKTGNPPWTDWETKTKDNNVLENTGTNAPDSQH